MEGLNKILLRLFAAFTILGFFLLMAGLIVGPNEVSGETVVRVLDADEYTLVN